MIKKEREWRKRKNGEVIYPQSRWLRFTWQKQSKTERESSRGTVGLCIGMETACFVVALPLFCISLSLSVSLILSLSLCVHIETSILETEERERERFWSSAYLLLAMLPLRPSKQGEYTYTHSFSRHRGEQLGSVLHWKPHFPSIRQTGRQLGVTLNPFPHVSLLTRTPLLLSLLSFCCSLYSTPLA